MFLMAILPAARENVGKPKKALNFRQLAAKASHIQGNKTNKIKGKNKEKLKGKGSMPCNSEFYCFKSF
jgi:hypothetical protein